MSDEDRPSAIRRKAGAGRPPPEIGRMNAAKALRLSVAQAAEDVAAMVVLATGVEEARVTPEGFTRDLPEHPLLALLEGPGNRFGMAVLDPQAMAALIEMQTTGRVVQGPAQGRAPTRTDAILAADFLDRVLEEFETQCDGAELPVAASVTGFRYALALEDLRAVGMTLEEAPYRRYSLTLDMGGGAKTGLIQLLFPHAPPTRPGQGQTGGAGWQDALHDAVADTRVDMSAVLMRMELPLGEVTGLQVGATLPVSGAALTGVRIEDLNDMLVAHGRLGQVGGYRAIRIADPNGAADAVTGTGLPAPVPGAARDAPGSDGDVASAALPDPIPSPIPSPMPAIEPEAMPMPEPMPDSMPEPMPKGLAEPGAADPDGLPSLPPLPMTSMDPAALADIVD